MIFYIYIYIYLYFPNITNIIKYKQGWQYNSTLHVMYGEYNTWLGYQRSFAYRAGRQQKKERDKEKMQEKKEGKIAIYICT